MTEPERPAGGWTTGRTVVLFLALLGMMGFGFWGFCGTLLAVAMPPDAGTIAAIAGGFVLSVLCFLLMRATIRRARGTRRQ